MSLKADRLKPDQQGFTTGDGIHIKPDPLLFDGEEQWQPEALGWRSWGPGGARMFPNLTRKQVRRMNHPRWLKERRADN